MENVNYLKKYINNTLTSVVKSYLQNKDQTKLSKQKISKKTGKEKIKSSSSKS